MREDSNIQEVALLEPDFMGFIFYKGSKRFVGNDWIMPQFPSSIKKVGVFVNALKEDILYKAEKYGLDYIQLHGDESVEFCAELSEHYEIIKVFSVDGEFDLEETAKYKPYAAYFLFDTKGDNYGGTGSSFDWNILKDYNNETPVFLSGGIGLDNVEQLMDLNHVNICAIDVNSKFEISPGVKDVNKLRKLHNMLSYTREKK